MHKNNSPATYVIVTLIMVVCFGLFQPKISSLIKPIRLFRLSHFVDKSIKNQSINMWDFWQMREFYFPGSITVHKSPTFQIVDLSEANQLSNQLGVECNPVLYSTFSSKKTQSQSYFVSKICAIPSGNSQIEKVLLQTSNDQIRETQDNTTMISLRSSTEMTSIDGYLSFDMKNSEFAAKYKSTNMITISIFDRR